MLHKFRVVAIFEAVSYLLLLSAVVLKRVLDGPDLVGILGPIHGIAFLVYLVLALAIRESQGWNLGQLLLVIIASALPFGGFVVERRLVDDTGVAARTGG